MNYVSPFLEYGLAQNSDPQVRELGQRFWLPVLKQMYRANKKIGDNSHALYIELIEISIRILPP